MRMRNFYMKKKFNELFVLIGVFQADIGHREKDGRDKSWMPWDNITYFKIKVFS